MTDPTGNDDFDFGHQPEVDFALNPEPRCPCLLLLDVSGSMSGLPIQELNAGIKAFQEDLIADDLAARRVEVAIVTFGPVNVATDFVGATAFMAPELLARGDTPTGEAISRGLSLLRQRKESYRTNGVKYYRPWVFLITDGEPTDDWRSAAEAIHASEAARELALFAVGVAGADMRVLSKIAVRQPLALREMKFRELFRWLSNSLSSVSRSSIGTEVELESPSEWALIPGGLSDDGDPNRHGPTVADAVMYMSARCQRTHQDFVVRVERHGRGWTVKAGLPKKPWEAASEDEVRTRGGVEVDPDFSCPHCRVGSLMRCDQCGNLTCWGGERTVKCQYCGLRGRVGGPVRSVTGFAG